MVFALDDLINGMLSPKFFPVTQVNEAVVGTPGIGMDNTLRTYTASDNWLRGLASPVRNNFRVELTVVFAMQNVYIAHDYRRVATERE